MFSVMTTLSSSISMASTADGSGALERLLRSRIRSEGHSLRQSCSSAAGSKRRACLVSASISPSDAGAWGARSGGAGFTGELTGPQPSRKASRLTS
jgi:hypothetical protein